MTKKTSAITSLALVAAFVILGYPGHAHAQSTSFSFQGKLADNGVPATGSYDMQFKLFDTVTLGTGTQQGTTLTMPVQVTNGIFTAVLDFGMSVFNLSPRYVEIGIRPAGSSDPYSLLDPRQQILSAPLAIRSLTASQADGLSMSCVNCVTSANISDGTLTAAKIAPQQVVKSIGGLKDDVQILAGSGISITQANNSVTIAAATPGPVTPMTHMTLSVTGVTGGNADGTIEVSSFTCGLKTGTGPGGLLPTNLHIVKGFDRASFQLQKDEVQLHVYPTVILNVYSIDAATQAETLNYRLTLTNAPIRLHRPNLAPPQSVSAAMEEVEFSYQKLKWEYLAPGVPTVVGCYNFTTLTQCP